jgi:hypothetical protein
MSNPNYDFSIPPEADKKKFFRSASVFLTIPKPLKQYTLFKKAYPSRAHLSPSCRLYAPEAGLVA